MKAERTRHLINEIDCLTVNAPSQLKNRDHALRHIYAAEKELCEIEEKATKWDEKETPVKPKEDEYGFNVCVKCDSLVESEHGNIFNYCPNCGQRIV